MSMDIQKGKLVGQQGPGSIYIDTDGSSYIISSADKWYNPNIKNKHINQVDLELHDVRLEKILNVDKFLEVPDYRTTHAKGQVVNTKLQIPVARFPLLEYCSKCGNLNQAKPTYGGKSRRCIYCKKKRNFIQFPIIVMCKNGHIYDFPYFFFIHTGTSKDENCKYQWVERKGTSILDWTLRCTCGAAHSLAGVTGRSNDGGGSPYVNEMRGAKCMGKMPWAGENKEHECHETPIAVLKNALNVYRPETIEALSLASDKSQFSSSISFEELFYQEFERLNTSIDNDDKEKLNVHQSFSVDSNKIIKSVNEVRRLQQLVVQTNFHREEPSDDLENYEKATQDSVDSLVFSYEYKDRTWYPAKKEYGEGVFIELNSAVLESWQDTLSVRERYDNCSKRVGSFYLKERFSNPSSILIHTLSHALIKEFSKSSGYPMTSIRERLYLDEGSQGILLYVTDSDKAGTYGGLVRLAKKEKFELILNKAIRNIEWCSSDPVCYEIGGQTGQGIQNSNGAACHNCIFVPSTSCSNRNCFLDRDYLSREESETRITRWFGFL
ncbi:MAG: DUF1998 domain-containing protein [Staphylococcus equorum]|nr:DUF1998 domain-containing protein [Staphylococcus equorum]MDN6735468.1 DUF1998 domain-containing protein [Tetragenococcus koreensis]MDN6749184.1 DUF1998 domain-containing protein [Staphylococcus equorum]